MFDDLHGLDSFAVRSRSLFIVQTDTSCRFLVHSIHSSADETVRLSQSHNRPGLTNPVSLSTYSIPTVAEYGPRRADLDEHHDAQRHSEYQVSQSGSSMLVNYPNIRLSILQKSNVSIQGFDDIEVLSIGASKVVSIGINFNDKTQPAPFEISFDGNAQPTSLTVSCHVGELIEQRFLNEQEFNQNLGKDNTALTFVCTTLPAFIAARLRGMNETTATVSMDETQIAALNFSTVQTKVVQCANLTSVPSGSGDSSVFR